MLVSRGLKKLRPTVRMVRPCSRTVASGAALLARPGSSSLAYCTRASLNSAPPNTDDSEAFSVSVWTRLSPVCSRALVAPPFSKLVPVKSCQL